MAIRPADHGVVASAGGAVPITATGGTITTHGIYKVHTFTASGTFQITANPSAATMDVLMVGGGGGSKRNYAWIVPGGGGGGSLIASAGAAGTVKSYTIVIGAGGVSDQLGGVTTMTDFTNCGGGGYSVDDTNNGGPITLGGAGSGRGVNAYGGGTNAGMSGVNGGDGGLGDQNLTNIGGSGGGGAGGSGGGDGSDGSTTSGSPYPTCRGGDGADGLTNVYQTGVTQNYAGGGGGAAIAYVSAYYFGGAGGDGGGGYGKGQDSPGGGAGTDGTANTGGGAGGKVAGTGGSGIVVIRYLA